MPLERFLQLLVEEQNTLVHPSAWDDPFEKLINNSASLRYDQRDFPNEPKEIKLNGDNWYGQCWSMEEESDALWKVFSQNTTERCVKVVTTYGKLKASIKSYEDNDTNFFIDAVSYSNSFEDGYADALLHWIEKYQKITSLSQQCFELSLLLTKRKIYEHEKEVRLLAYVKDGTMSLNTRDNLYKYHIEIDRLIDEVELDPWMPNYTSEMIQAIVKSRRIKVRKSHIYDDIKKTGGLLFSVEPKVEINPVETGSSMKRYTIKVLGKEIQIKNRLTNKLVGSGLLPNSNHS